MTGQELQLRDKNKSAFKLQGLPHIYWLNLDADVKRREYMEDSLSIGKSRIILAFLDMMEGKMMSLLI
ncbi:MAG: hypothetical protein CM15mV24_0960 [Bellamyvirus sp.]|nr:MAG: hypothetical protein CM15mV24_0960 [Bellamyvirus sp.]